MPADSAITRSKLIRAGERLFAERGIHGAGMLDIVRAGGQANGSAVHYHFGSRQGLILAICNEHIARMEPERLRRVASHGTDPGLDPLVADMVEATAAELDDQRGRYFLRIVAQLVSYAAVEPLRLPASLTGTALQTQLDQLERACHARLPRGVATERNRLVISMLAAELGYRAAAIDHDQSVVLDHAAFVDNLRVVIVSMLTAPVPVAAAERRRRSG